MALYADIVEIVAPGVAVSGSRVDITVKVKNTYTSPIGIMVGGALECGITPWPAITFPSNVANVDAGVTHSFTGYFVMPDRDVKIHAYSYYYGADGNWHLDDEMTRDVTLATSAYQGTITKKELEYDETRGSIPVSGVPQNKRGLVHIWGRNDTASAQRMGISWVVQDPDGLTIEEYSAWEAWPYTGAGKEHEFIGGRFNLNKSGRYRIWVHLFMNPDSPEVVDIYYGDLCTVEPELVEEFKSFAVLSLYKV